LITSSWGGIIRHLFFLDGLPCAPGRLKWHRASAFWQRTQFSDVSLPFEVFALYCNFCALHLSHAARVLFSPAAAAAAVTGAGAGAGAAESLLPELMNNLLLVVVALRGKPLLRRAQILVVEERSRIVETTFSGETGAQRGFKLAITIRRRQQWFKEEGTDANSAWPTACIWLQCNISDSRSFAVSFPSKAANHMNHD